MAPDCFHVLAGVDGGILFSREKEENCAICRDVHGPKDSHRVIRKRKQVSNSNTYMRNPENGRDEPIYKAEMETQTDRANIQTPSVAAGHEQGGGN